MYLKAFSTLIFLIIITGMCACENVDKNGLSCEDKNTLMTNALQGQYFLESYSEFHPSDSTIHIIDTTSSSTDCIKKIKHKPAIAFTDSFNFDRTFLEQGRDKRFSISLPQFKKVGDTIEVNFYSYNFYSSYIYKFVKKDQQWKLVFQTERMQ